MSGKRLVAVVALVALTAGVAIAAAPTDRVLPAHEYTTEKARALASAHVHALQELSAGIYHCWPWVDVPRNGIGFYRPRGAQQDDRHLSTRISIEQEPSPAFASLRFEERATAMFSRYIPPLLRRMTKDPNVAADPKLDGFTAIVDWPKPAPRGTGRPVSETIAVFIDKASALEFLSGRGDIKTLPSHARVLGFDGETPLGQITLGPAWDDNFVATFKVANYQLEPGVVCN
ncbi:MAG: hypothetical protein FJZ38_02570 [Candidatus Rokubacteria bacterium]|nr:hypothetical protein [Candidatus Rokubacteria bacterium]